MHESVENISSDKRLGDKLNREIELIRDDKDKLSHEGKQMRLDISKIM